MTTRIRRTVHLAMATLLAGALPASAQVTKELIITEPLRVQVAGEVVEYRFHAWEPEHLMLQPFDGPMEGRYRIPFRDIEEIRVQVPDPAGRSMVGQALRNGLWGGAIGTVIGAIIGDPIFGFVLGTVPGAVFGILTGVFAPPTLRWLPLTLPLVPEATPSR